MKRIFSPVAVVVYFFFNVVGLPAPVSWTSIFSGFLAQRVFQNHRRVIGIVGALLVVYACIHLVLGVQVKDYFKSALFFGYLLFSAFAAYEFLNTRVNSFVIPFRWLSLGAFGLTAVGFLTLNTDLEKYFWLEHDFIGQGDRLMRFYGLSYEPSHLALTLSPLFLYFLIKSILKPTWISFGCLAAVSVPIALTVSFGFAGALALTIFAMIGILLFTSVGFRKRLLIPVALAGLAVLAVCSFSNTLSDRVFHIFSGGDTSVNGRTTEAFLLAYRCAETKSVWFGIGPGQVKIVGEKVIRPFYAKWDPVGYSKENWPVMGLPNSMAETLAMFGITGVLLKLGVQFFLFWRFRVYRNYFSMAVFCFIFFYQLMGSFMLSTTEMMMWVLAVVPLFPEWDVTPKNASVS